MSLINKMLQALEQRRADPATTNEALGQIRAVSTPRSIHPAWWMAMLLAVVLIAAITWRLLERHATQPGTASSSTSTATTALPIISATPVIKTPNIARSENSSAATVAATPADNTAAIPEATPQRPVPPPTTTAFEVPAVTPHQADAPTPTTETILTTATRPAAVPTETLPADGATPSIQKQIIQPTPQQHADNEYREAIRLVQQGQLSAAITHLEQALLFYPPHTAARQTLAGALLESGRRDAALTVLHEGLALDLRQAGLAMILARLQVESGELPAALATLENTLPHAADQADYQAFLAALLQRAQRHKQAIDHYWIALRLKPQHSVWWMGMGISLEAEKRLPEAREAFTTAANTNNLPANLQAFVADKIKRLKP